MKPQPILDTHVIDMYAALAANPVTVSYPEGQMRTDDSDIYSYKYNHDFSTFYTFGPYRLQHIEVARLDEHSRGFGQELVFTETGTTLHIPIQISKYSKEFKQGYIDLYNAIMAKAGGKTFTNPYVESINNSVYFLEKYILEAPDALLSPQGTADKNTLFQQLDNIKTLLLTSQHAITK
ncbi:MAG: hypothetical protein J6T57_04665 [Alphaproteobacteria bacterium]|nr:hypothetical protein [Alphaproteobacteria bacterium]